MAQQPIWIVDHNEKLVFSPKTGDAHIVSVNPEVAKYRATDDNNDEIDYLQIQLPFSLGTPLKINPDIVLQAEIFIPAFAEPTIDRMSQFGVPDADGKSLTFTIGKTIDVVEAFRRRKLDVNKYANAAQQKQVWGHFIFSTADGNSSTSGSPILKSSGEVVGIHVATWRLGFTGPDSVVNEGLSFFNIP